MQVRVLHLIAGETLKLPPVAVADTPLTALADEDTPITALASLLESVLESRVNILQSFDTIYITRPRITTS